METLTVQNEVSKMARTLQRDRAVLLLREAVTHCVSLGLTEQEVESTVEETLSQIEESCAEDE